MKKMTLILFFLVAHILSNLVSARAGIEPILISDFYQSHRATRSLYSLDARFSASDTIMFLHKPKRLQILRVDSLSTHELSFVVQVDSGFYDFDSHVLVVLDTNFSRKILDTLVVRYSRPPRIDRVLLSRAGEETEGVLRLAVAGRTMAYMTILGDGLFRTSQVEFDDPNIKVLNTPGWRADDPPRLITVGLEIDGAKVEVGPKRFRVKNKYAMESWGEILVQSPYPPRIFSRVRSFVADGSERIITLLGDNFHRGLRASLLPPDGLARVRFKSRGQVEVLLGLPVLEQSKSYRLILTNPDGQADTTAFFTVQAKPLGRARVKTIEKGSIFYGKETRVVFAISGDDSRKFSKKRSYEINIEGNRFPVLAVLDDSTCEAVIRIEEGETSQLINRHVFTIREVDGPPRWRGELFCRPAPKLTYMSPQRIIHPVDTLTIVFKGKNLEGVSMYVEDPELAFEIKENRGDLLRVRAIAGRFVSPGSYPIELRIDGVPFVFENYRLEIQPWQPFHEYVGIEISSLGFIPPKKLWRGSGVAHLIEASDAINVRFFGGKIREELGTQKVIISGVLMDSSNTIRAEAFDRRLIEISKGTDIVNWHWRVRERVRSGDRIEITLRNPGGQNKVTEVFYVKPHWSEAFHGSTSFILFKIPFGGGEASTEIFRSMGIGISYQPFTGQKFLAFDGSFILGNVNKGDNNLSVEVGIGFSVILWSHLQIGIGTNLTGSSFNHGFTFVGTRFKLPVPW